MADPSKPYGVGGGHINDNHNDHDDDCAEVQDLAGSFSGTINCAAATDIKGSDLRAGGQDALPCDNSVAVKMTPDKLLCGTPQNGCVNIMKTHNLDDNGIVKVNEHTLRECVGAQCTVTEEASSTLATDSEECPTPSTDKTQLSDSDSPGEEAARETSVTDMSPLCDSLASISISNQTDKQCQQDLKSGIEYVVYKSELQMANIMRLITKDLSEPYSIYTYRYFIHNWPKLCFLAMDGSRCVGAIVCKLDVHKKLARRGYIAMLAVDQQCRRRGIGSHLVLKAIKAMVDDDCDEVVLETEITNKAALHLYENLGFVRDKRLFRYYLNGVDALRLKLWLK